MNTLKNTPSSSSHRERIWRRTPKADLTSAGRWELGQLAVRDGQFAPLSQEAAMHLARFYETDSKGNC